MVLDKFEVRTENNKSYLVKHNKDIKLDLATVGEGLGADAVAAKLVQEGYKNFMVNVAGASRSYGVNAKGKSGDWELKILPPLKDEYLYQSVHWQSCNYSRLFTETTLK